MKRILTFFTAVLAAVLPLCASQPADSPADRQETKEYRLSGFSGLEVSSIYQVELTQSSRYAVKVEAPDFLIPLLRVEVRAGVLQLALQDLPLDIRRRLETGRHRIRAEVSMPELNSLRMSGASKLNATGEFSTRKKFDLRLSGATNVVKLSVNAPEASLECSGASNLYLTGRYDIARIDLSGSVKAVLNVDAREAAVRLSGAAKLSDKGTLGKLGITASGAASFELKGALTDLDVTGSGSAKIKFSDVSARTAKIGLSGAANAVIDVRDELSVSLSGAASLRYHGGERLKIVHQNVSRGATLSSF